MPSEKILEGKKAEVSALREDLLSTGAGVLVSYKGISVADDTKLRADLRKEGVRYKVVKNTLLKLAIEGTPLEGLGSCLEGTTALALSKEDPMAAAKILGKYSEKTKGAFAIKMGYIDGEILGADGVMELSRIPNREGLLSMLLSVLNAGPRGLAVALGRVAEQKQSA